MELIDRLAGHATLGQAPREELAWLAAHASLRHLAEGDLLAATGQPVEGLFIIASGHLAIFIDRGAGAHKVMDWRAGDVSGMLPYSRLVASPGNAVALEPSVVLVLPRDRINEMIRECHEVTSILVQKMVDRTRVFTSSDLRDEKLVSLGRLSAGLAHELNNPVSAIERSAHLLEDRLDEAERAARLIGACHLTDVQVAAIDALRASCLAHVDVGVRSPIEEAEREDAMSAWLASHGLDEAIAPPLAETSVTLEVLDRIAAAVSGPALDAVLRWAAAGCSVRALASEIQQAASRISGLVAAIKGFTHMDRAPVAEPLDLDASLANTVTVLRSKAKAKSASIAVTIETGLPRVRGFVGELNQIWGNLLDNAIDAVPPGGRVDVIVKHERQRVVVRVIDNGPGIPASARDHIWEPFFTTKPVGQGTGLGLDIVRRLVMHNDGDIDLESRPGHTEFRVSLPLAETPVAGGRA